MAGGMSAGYLLYRGGTALLSPLARLFLAARVRRGKEDPARLEERMGRSRIARPPGPLVWLHGASIGESLALLPLIARLRQRGFVILLTTGTQSSAQVLAARLPPDVLHQFAPLDLPGAVRAFLDHWRPAALVLAESELWPNLIQACSVRNLPVALVNARLSERSFARWRRAPGMARAMLGKLALCAAQSEADARRFAGLGARNLIVTENLKHDGAPPPFDSLELARLRGAIGPRPVLVAASTHDGEEKIVIAAHLAVSHRHPDLLTIVAPRDVSRANSIGVAATDAGLTAARRSRGSAIGREVQIFVADTFGEMGLWLRLASVAVIGKTFEEASGAGGGQTPAEAVRCGAVVLHGSSVYNFADVFAALDRAGGALEVSESTVAETIAMLLREPETRRAMARAASRTLEALAGATDRTLAALEPVLASVAPEAPVS